MTALNALAERLANGQAACEADARAILATSDLIAVGVLADDVRRRMHGARTTFVRVFEIHVDAVPSVLPPHTSSGEFRIVGRPSTVEAAITAVRASAAIAGATPLTGFSLADLLGLAAAGSSLRKMCGRLRDAGLCAVAELPLDLPDAAAAVSDARSAGLAVPRLTVTSLHEEQRIPFVTRARDLQETLGEFRVFAPLPRTASISTPSTGYDDVKQVALARVMASNIESIQVDWALYGPKLAQVALTVGADDVDGVAAIDPGALGTRRSPIEEIRSNIRAAGLEAVERNGRFEVIA